MSFVFRSIIKFHSRKLFDWFRFGLLCDLISVRSVALFLGDSATVQFNVHTNAKANAVHKTHAHTHAQTNIETAAAKKNQTTSAHKSLFGTWNLA